MSRQYNAVLFDLLSALLDSWSLWDDLAGDPVLGRQWRMHYLDLTYRTTQYQPYLELVRESAAAVGVKMTQAETLANRWNELTPWPEAAEVLVELASRFRIGVITNCSQDLGLEAVSRLGIEFDVILTAERAGYYKPAPEIYAMAMTRIREAPEHILYIAGSPYDVRGAANAGMPVFWHNRVGLLDDQASSTAIRSSNTLNDVVTFIV
jgi:2-haloalkanoic acid dehalogenase type II